MTKALLFMMKLPSYFKACDDAKPQGTMVTKALLFMMKLYLAILRLMTMLNHWVITGDDGD